MANLGKQLLSPDAGWQRIDDTDSRIIYSDNVSWEVEKSVSGNSDGTHHIYRQAEGQIPKITFYIYSDKLRIISAINNDHSSNLSIKIDDEKSEKLSHYNDYLQRATLTFEKKFSEIAYHKIEISRPANERSIIGLDAIDVNINGDLITEEEYLNHLVQEFPVKIGDETVTSEEDVKAYAETLIDGERQLLILSTTMEMFLTDGIGGYSKFASSDTGIDISNRDLLEKFSLSDEGRLLFDGKTIESDIDTSTLLTKEIYDSDNDGVVDKAKVADELSVMRKTQPLMYYGTNSRNEVGLYYFPINGNDNLNFNIEQKVILNSEIDKSSYFESVSDTNNHKMIVDCYKFIPGEENVVTTIKEFNNSDKDNFTYDKDKVSFQNGMHITNNYVFNSIRKDSYYEVDFYNDFINIEEIGEE